MAEILLPKDDYQLSILHADGWVQGSSLHMPSDLECCP